LVQTGTNAFRTRPSDQLQLVICQYSCTVPRGTAVQVHMTKYFLIRTFRLELGVWPKNICQSWVMFLSWIFLIRIISVHTFPAQIRPEFASADHPIL
jgi:hypothetical protein